MLLAPRPEVARGPLERDVTRARWGRMLTEASYSLGEHDAARAWGDKTFRWVEGGKNQEQTFNYSLDADAQALHDWFEKMTPDGRDYTRLAHMRALHAFTNRKRRELLAEAATS